MLRRNLFLLASSIPRSAWDPAHSNENWVDSYSTSIADRRHWPAKKWSIGLEPRTPRDWLRFSHRNLAYAYNGALRACGSFPEMLIYYNEMKQRGVSVDVDTLNVLLTRAARYEGIETDDVFLLFDELTSLGARPDIASVETLHTVLEHSEHKPFEWREARRRQLVELYQYLALEEIERLAPHHVDALLSSQMARLRANLKQLKASLSPSVYRRYLSLVDCGETVIQGVHHCLWEYVASDHAALDVPSLQLRIPFVGSVLRRPPADAPPATVKETDFEDADVCSVFLAALERCIVADFHDARPVSERRMYLALLTMLTSSGALYTADLMAQLMDVVKYSSDDRGRDRDAQRLLRYAMRGSSAMHDSGHRRLWNQVAPAVDARVVGRYLASRDPWSPTRICCDRHMQFGTYSPMQLTQSPSTAGASETAEGGGGSGAGDHEAEGVPGDTLPTASPTEPADAAKARASALVPRSAESLEQRWRDVLQLVDQTAVLRRVRDDQRQSSMEVFTGQMVFLRTVATGRRYGDAADAMSIQAVGEGVQPSTGAANRSDTMTSTLYAAGLDIDVWSQLLRCVQQCYQQMEAYMAAQKEQHGVSVEPEFECWEAMLITLRCILDYCVVHTQKYGRAAGGGTAEKLFEEAAKLRSQLVGESHSRFNGRLRILWLQEV